MKKKDSAKENSKRALALVSENSLLYDFSVMIICCFAGIIAKKLINPFANIATGFLHVPGGISTAFSLMFIVVGAAATKRKWCASAMGLMQAGAALTLGSVGSMGFLMVPAYFIPALVIDLIMLLPQGEVITVRLKAFIACILSSVSAAAFSNFVLFRLPVKVLAVYISLAAVSGAVSGIIAGGISSNLKKAKKNEER